MPESGCDIVLDFVVDSSCRAECIPSGACVEINAELVSEVISYGKFPSFKYVVRHWDIHSRSERVAKFWDHLNVRDASMSYSLLFLFLMF